MSAGARPTVGHIVGSFLPLTENWVFNQLSTLTNYRSIVLTYRRTDPPQFQFDPVFAFSDQTTPAKLWHKAGLKLTGINRFFASRARRENCVLIHAHFGPIGHEALRLKQALGIPLVTTFYGYDAGIVPRRPGWREKYARLFAQGDLFLAEGKHLRQTLIGLGCPPEKAIVQKLGVDLDGIKFSPRRLREDAPAKVLMAASFVEKKGFPDGLRALAEAKKQLDKVAVTIIGDGKLRPQIVKLIDELGLDAVLLGYQPHHRLLAEMADADLILHPSVTAADGDTEGGAPVSLIEAQAVGLPVVATAHADIPDIVVDGVTGLLAPERDIDGLAERLTTLLTDPERRAAFGRAGRAHVEKSHNLRTQVKKLEEIYDRVRG